MYGHAENLLTRCTGCGALAKFRDDDTLQPLCRGCLELADAKREAERLLRETPTRDLLRKAYALTHQVHSNDVLGRHEEADEKRAVRDMITAEVLRRADS